MQTQQNDALNLSLEYLSIAQIARHICRDWKKVNYAARPYLDAMLGMHAYVGDKYGADSCRSIVLYFLCNAGTWRGDLAKLIKAELKRRVS